MKLFCLLLVAGYLVACNGTGSTTNTTTPPGDSAVVNSDTASFKRDTTTLAGPWFLLPVLPTDTGAGRTPQLIFKLDDKTLPAIQAATA